MTDKLPNPDALQDAVSAYFQEVVTASLELPDGWFGGRPMDNYHQLTFIASRPGRLSLSLMSTCSSRSPARHADLARSLLRKVS